MKANLVLQFILIGTLRGAAMALAAVLLGPALGRILGRNCVHWLWILTLPAFLWPLPLPTPVSLRNLWSAKRPAAAVDASGGNLGLEAAVRYIYSESKAPPSESRDSVVAPSAPHSQMAMAAPRVTWEERLLGIWLFGLAGSLAHLAWRGRQTSRLLRTAQPPSDDRWAIVLRRLDASGLVGIASSASIRSPALAGLWRPHILLPDGWAGQLSTAELESILLHEIGHHRRRDLVWEWMFAIVRCVHWMNPAAWLAERLARQERELACDAWALDCSASPVVYGEALLAVLQRAQPSVRRTFGAVAMADHPRQIIRRIECITRHRRAPRWMSTVAWAPAVAAFALVATDPLAADPERQAAEPKPAVPLPTPPLGDTAAVQPLPIARRTYEITTRLLRLPETEVQRLGLPIAEEGSRGVLQVRPRPELQRLLEDARAVPKAEFWSIPRLASRSGTATSARIVREYRYPDDWSPAKSGLLIPTKIDETDLGLTMEAEALIKTGQSAAVHFGAELTRLLGVIDQGGKLTKISPFPKGTEWFQRLTADELPDGASGKPSFIVQKAKADLDLTTGDAVIVFGFRDVAEQTAAGRDGGTPFVNYILLQLEIFP